MSLGRAVLLGVVLLFFSGLGLRDLWAPDEPYFAEGAREMVADGQWVVPHVNGVVTTDKPPLLFWLIALFSLPLGDVNEWTARLPSALAALGTVALVMRLAGRWYGPRTAALAGAMLATTFLFWQKARWCQTDMVLCFLIWVALSAFEALRGGTMRANRAGLLFWLAIGLAVLTKGPVGLLLPLGIALVTLAWDRELGKWWRFAPWSGPLLFALVVGAWIAWTELGGPEGYSVWSALEEHFVNRGLEGMHHKRPPWYFLGVTPPNLLPWMGLVPGGLVLAWRRRTAADRLPFAVALFVLIFFSVSTEKRELYMLPAYPAFALLTAALTAAVCGWSEPAAPERVWVSRRWLTVGHGIVAGFLALLGASALVLAGRYEELPAGPARALAVLAIAGGAVTLYLLLRRRPAAAVAAMAVAMGAVLLLGSTFVLPSLNDTKSARPFAERMAGATAAARACGVPVLAYRIGNLPEPLAFYSRGVYTIEADEPEALKAHLDRPQEAFAVLSRGSLEGFSDLAAEVEVVTSLELSRRELVLVGNRRPGCAAEPR